MRTATETEAHSLSHQCLRTAAICVHQARQAAALAHDPPHILALLNQLASNIERMHHAMRN